MTRFEQDDTVYEFPDEYPVLPGFDEQAFYRKLSGSDVFHAKGCDIVAIYRGTSLYLIEAKDYAHAHPGKPRKKSGDLAFEVARKSFDTLACIVVGAHQATDEDVRRFCSDALDCEDLYIVVTVELSRNPHARMGFDDDVLYRRNLQEQLKRNVKCLGARHVIVTWNGDDENAHKFWTSRWSAAHD